MSSKLSIAKDLRPLLLAKPDLTALVGQNIFPLYVPEGTSGDFILYQRTGGGSERNNMGVSDEWCDITFNAVSDSYVRSVEIAEQIRVAFQDITVEEEPLILTHNSEDYIGVGNVIKYVQILVFSLGKPEE
jgi:hypothetical protein